MYTILSLSLSLTHTHSHSHSHTHTHTDADGVCTVLAIPRKIARKNYLKFDDDATSMRLFQQSFLDAYCFTTAALLQS